MKVLLNGRPSEVEPGSSLLDLVPAPDGIAVALNGAVVPAAAWAATRLSEDDAVEVVTARQGG